MPENEVRVRVTGDTSGWEAAVRRIDTTAGFFNLQQGLLKLNDALREPIGQAVALGESVNAVNVVFGDSAQQITDWGRTTANAYGLSQRAFNQAVTPIGAMLQNLGLAQDQAAESSIRLTERAADLASVFNTDVNDALTAIQAALRGEADPIERFGISVKAAEVSSRALADTGKELASELTNQELAAARLAIIFEQSAKVEGDFANTSDSLANATRVLNASLEDGRTQLVNRFLPALETGIGLFTQLPSEVQVGTVALLQFGPALAQTGLGLASLTAAATQAGPAITRMIAAARTGGPVFLALAAGIGAVVAAGELLGDNVPEWNGVLGNLSDKSEQVAFLQERLAESTGFEADAIRELIGRLEGQIQAESEAVEWQEKHATAATGAADATAIFNAEMQAANRTLIELITNGYRGVSAIKDLSGTLTAIGEATGAAVEAQNAAIQEQNRQILEMQGISAPDISDILGIEEGALSPIVSTMGEYNNLLRENQIESLEAQGVTRELAEQIVAEREALEAANETRKEATKTQAEFLQEMLEMTGVLPEVAREMVGFAEDGVKGLTAEILIANGATPQLAAQLLVLRDSAAVANEEVEKLRNAVEGYGDALIETFRIGTPQIPTPVIPMRDMGFSPSQQTTTTFQEQFAAPVGTYALGTPWVPQDGMYMLHRGERVVTAADNRNYGNNRSVRVTGPVTIIYQNGSRGAGLRDDLALARIAG